ncbi:MAG: hypothetical protein ACK5JT_11425, partial [Hyphomicrobiaceae bacterium]
LAPAEAAAEDAGQLVETLKSRTFELRDGNGRTIGKKWRNEAPAVQLTVVSVARSLREGRPDPDQIVWLWGFFASDSNKSLADLAIIKALASVSVTAQEREALWSELSAQAKRREDKSPASAHLLGVFERNRSTLLPLLPPIRENEGGGDEMARLMVNSKVFGDDIDDSLADMVQRNPGAVARMIERERERGREVDWEVDAFDGLMAWKKRHLVAGAPQAPKTLAALDSAGESFITAFNALHSLAPWFRKQMLGGLGPVQLFNAVVGGEQELYRLGTSGYRSYLHGVILEGITESGSFEAFLDRAAPSWLGEDTPSLRTRRGMVFLRIASSFGLLPSVLEAIDDGERFIDNALDALGDPLAFEGSNTIVVDILTSRSTGQITDEFRDALLDRLYARFGSEEVPERRNVYGGMIAAYQAVTGDRRDPAIDREFPINQALLQLPFDRLFARNAKGQFVHRMFMRMENDTDGAATFRGFEALMKRLGANRRPRETYVRYRFRQSNRVIEIYVNRPTSAGVHKGMEDLKKELANEPVQTVIGRGHTGIITPFQTDTKRVLGDGLKKISVVFVGTCGGDASVKELLGTFGYVPIIATKSTGRQVLNNAIIWTYIKTLRSLRPGHHMALRDVVDAAMTPYMRRHVEEEVREDAKLYRVNLTTAIAAQLYAASVEPTGPAPVIESHLER